MAGGRVLNGRKLDESRLNSPKPGWADSIKCSSAFPGEALRARYLPGPGF